MSWVFAEYQPPGNVQGVISIFQLRIWQLSFRPSVFIWVTREEEGSGGSGTKFVSEARGELRSHFSRLLESKGYPREDLVGCPLGCHVPPGFLAAQFQ